MLEFEPSVFLKRIAFIGDSFGRQQFQFLMCLATAGEVSLGVENVRRKYGLGKARGAISSHVAMHLDRPLAFSRRFLHQFDVLVLNTGHHWYMFKLNANLWVMFVDGKCSENKKLAEIENAKKFTIHSIVRWLDLQLPLHQRLKVFFRTISPRHYVNGDWNTRGSCDNTTPLLVGSEVQDGSIDPIIEGAIKGTQVKILYITAISRLRDEGHMSHSRVRRTVVQNDCLHWCLPGISNTWYELLIAQI
ncbi:hypothetical protein I3760_03G112400 [Carya illinoinensis]|nr:hypothetical protein I3760_03G112400 [Carya illinoinensis]